MRNRLVAQTQAQDGEIISLYLGLNGERLNPKRIVLALSLSSIHVVYGAIRRWKYRKGWFHIEPKTNKEI